MAERSTRCCAHACIFIPRSSHVFNLWIWLKIVFDATRSATHVAFKSHSNRLRYQPQTSAKLHNVCLFEDATTIHKVGSHVDWVKYLVLYLHKVSSVFLALGSICKWKHKWWNLWRRVSQISCLCLLKWILWVVHNTVWTSSITRIFISSLVVPQVRSRAHHDVGSTMHTRRARADKLHRLPTGTQVDHFAILMQTKIFFWCHWFPELVP